MSVIIGAVETVSDEETRYYITITGVYVGGFCGVTGAELRGFIEVPSAPENALDTWDGMAWVPYVE